MFKANCSLLLHFEYALKWNNIFEQFYIGKLHVNRFQKWIKSSNSVPVKKIADVMRAMTSASWKPLKLTMLAGNPVMIFRRYLLPRWTKFCDFYQQIQVFANRSLLCKPRRFCFAGHHCFIRTQGPHIFLHYSNGTESSSSKSSEALPFIFDREAHRLYWAEDLEGLEGFCRGCWHCPACELSYTLFFVRLGEKNSSCAERAGQNFVPSEKSLRTPHREGPVHNKDDADRVFCYRPNSADAVLQFVTNLFLDHIGSVICNNILYRMQEVWAEFAQYLQQRNKLLVGFRSLPSFVTIVLDMTCLHHSQHFSLT